MAYDYTGSWGSISGHQANLHPSEDNAASTPFSTEKAVDYYLGAGVTPGKLVLGMPIYGRTFQNTTGSGRAFSGIRDGS
ncbi:Chitinase 4 [Pyricularia oryzae]